MTEIEKKLIAELSVIAEQLNQSKLWMHWNVAKDINTAIDKLKGMDNETEPNEELRMPNPDHVRRELNE